MPKISLKKRKENATKAVEALKKEYPGDLCSLCFDKPYELLFATRLAAQCTDERVNLITEDLYKVYPTLEAFAKAEVKDVEDIVRPCGLGPTKARDIVAAANMLLDDFDGEVPSEMDDLLKLPGIGRKTANIIRGDVFGLPAIPVDTHCLRITNLLGLANSKYPDTVEKQLQQVLEPSETNDFCHRLVLHGRAVCVARRPDCENCVMASFCQHALEQERKTKES